MSDEYKTNIVCVYHDHCPDGITAFWVVSRYYSAGPSPYPSPYPAKYDKAPDLELLRGKDVVLVDFCWSFHDMCTVAHIAKSLMVLDHHKTSEETIKRLIPMFRNVIGVWDNDRSGAGLAWDRLFGVARPDLINYVEDRDLWRWALPGSREVSAACSLLSLSLEDRETLMATPIAELRARGEIVLAHQNRLIEQGSFYRPRRIIGGCDVPCVPCQFPSLLSELGHALCRGELFSATYQVRNDGSAKVSLRSNENGLDVSEIAKAYGGGGHKHAAGFSVPDIETLEFVHPVSGSPEPEAAR